ncbi:hypothetical protein HNR46_002174 [Haloferula luteola]|uniref:Uncharacterized protein n=1 Tax=Haloferula luteola TaxID=595692 RepID=A0A840V1S1_9BACT|nr:hypothetical protein [Haloferula luteola]MBB5351935.1 hypothetical protein [Haloferula luteola]
MPMDDDDFDRDWADASAMVSPALLGVAAGLILGEVMHANARRGIAVALAGLGVAALLPKAVTGIVDKVNGPESRRGQQRRLRGIRDAGDGVDELLEESGIV